MKLRTADVPQADSLALVRRVLEAVASSPGGSVNEISERTGFSGRHVRYRVQAARILGLLSEESESALTVLGRSLLATPSGSQQEKEVLAAAVRGSKCVSQLAPRLLDRESVDVKSLAERIARLSGLSQSTAERRAVVLRSWHRDLR